MNQDERQSFSDFEAIHNKPMQSSVITTLPSELFQFPFFEMLDNLSNEELSQVKKNLAMCPSDE